MAPAASCSSSECHCSCKAPPDDDVFAFMQNDDPEAPDEVIAMPSAEAVNGKEKGKAAAQRSPSPALVAAVKADAAPSDAPAASTSGGMRKGFLLAETKKDAAPPTPAPPLTATAKRKEKEKLKKEKQKENVAPEPTVVAQPEPVVEADPEPESIVEEEKPEPIKCHLCHKTFQPKEEKYYKMECTNDCELLVHNGCFNDEMTKQGLKKKGMRKDSKCPTADCGADVSFITEFGMDNKGVLYLKCAGADVAKLDAATSATATHKKEKAGKARKDKDNRHKKDWKESSVPVEAAVAEEEAEEEPPAAAAPVEAKPKPAAKKNPLAMPLSVDMPANRLVKADPLADKYLVRDDNKDKEAARKKEKKERKVVIQLDDIRVQRNGDMDDDRDSSVPDEWDGDDELHSIGETFGQPAQFHGHMPDAVHSGHYDPYGNPYMAPVPQPLLSQPLIPFAAPPVHNGMYYEQPQQQHQFPPPQMQYGEPPLAFSMDDFIMDQLLKRFTPSIIDDIRYNTPPESQEIGLLLTTVQLVASHTLSSEDLVSLGNIFKDEAKVRRFVGKLDLFVISKVDGRIMYKLKNEHMPANMHFGEADPVVGQAPAPIAPVVSAIVREAQEKDDQLTTKLQQRQLLLEKKKQEQLEKEQREREEEKRRQEEQRKRVEEKSAKVDEGLELIAQMLRGKAQEGAAVAAAQDGRVVDKVVQPQPIGIGRLAKKTSQQEDDKDRIAREICEENRKMQQDLEEKARRMEEERIKLAKEHDRALEEARRALRREQDDKREQLQLNDPATDGGQDSRDESPAVVEETRAASLEDEAATLPAPVPEAETEDDSVNEAVAAPVQHQRLSAFTGFGQQTASSGSSAATSRSATPAVAAKKTYQTANPFAPKPVVAEPEQPVVEEEVVPIAVAAAANVFHEPVMSVTEHEALLAAQRREMEDKIAQMERELAAARRRADAVLAEKMGAEQRSLLLRGEVDEANERAGRVETECNKKVALAAAKATQSELRAADSDARANDFKKAALLSATERKLASARSSLHHIKMIENKAEGRFDEFVLDDVRMCIIMWESAVDQLIERRRHIMNGLVNEKQLPQVDPPEMPPTMTTIYQQAVQHGSRNHDRRINQVCDAVRARVEPHLSRHGKPMPSVSHLRALISRHDQQTYPRTDMIDVAAAAEHVCVELGLQKPDRGNAWSHDGAGSSQNGGRSVNVSDHECKVCLEVIGTRESLVCEQTTCAEPFHKQCIVSWLSMKAGCGSCPNCNVPWPNPEAFPSLGAR